MYELPVLLRTDFSDDATWQAITREVTAVECVDDAEHASVDEENVRGVLAGYRHGFVLLADARSMTRAGHPLLVVDLSEEEEPSFRVLPGTVGPMVGDLAEETREIAEFGEAADLEDDGVFRGFGARDLLN